MVPHQTGEAVHVQCTGAVRDAHEGTATGVVCVPILVEFLQHYPFPRKLERDLLQCQVVKLLSGGNVGVVTGGTCMYPYNMWAWLQVT